MKVFYINPKNPCATMSPEELGTAYGKVYRTFSEAQKDLLDPMNDDLDHDCEIVECELHQLPDCLYGAGKALAERGSVTLRAYLRGALCSTVTIPPQAEGGAERQRRIVYGWKRQIKTEFSGSGRVRFETENT